MKKEGRAVFSRAGCRKKCVGKVKKMKTKMKKKKKRNKERRKKKIKKEKKGEGFWGFVRFSSPCGRRCWGSGGADSNTSGSARQSKTRRAVASWSCPRSRRPPVFLPNHRSVLIICFGLHSQPFQSNFDSFHQVDRIATKCREPGKYGPSGRL